MSVKVLASLSLEETRARVWGSVFSDSSSDDYLAATLADLQAPSWESETGIESTVERMIFYWENHTINMALCYANGILVLDVDADRDGSAEYSVGLLHRWINEYANAPT